jgi:scyllo-inositol 2-dehydrogenase (NADP+)
MSSNGKKVRGAVIGYGGAFNMGKQHANQMKKFGIEFVAACDLDAARMEQAKSDFPDIRTFTRVEDLLAQSEFHNNIALKIDALSHRTVRSMV